MTLGHGQSDGLGIRQVAERTGITGHTLRHDERIGLFHHVPRARSGHRCHVEADLQWLELFERLRATEMPIRACSSTVASPMIRTSTT